MSMKRVLLGTVTVLMVLLGRSVGRAQGPSGLYGGPAAPDTSAAAGSPEDTARQRPTTFVPSSALSQFLIGTDPDCCGPVIDGNPLKTELYLRSGFSTVFGNGALAHDLGTGWLIEGGLRSLLFNPRGDAAWTFDLGLTNIFNNGRNSATQVTLLNVNLPDPATQGRVTLPSVLVTPHSLNRTFVDLGAGREWYLFGGAANTRDTPHPGRWRIGIDGGGRWGTERLDLREIKHQTDTIGGVYAALTTDVDFPCGCAVFLVGFRLEWDYTWSDVLQIQNKSDLMDINYVFNFGIRY
jgi:hypothetical protein